MIFASSGSLDWIAGNLLMQFTLNTSTVDPTKNMLLRSTKPKWIPVFHRSSYVRLCRVAAICMCMTVSLTMTLLHVQLVASTHETV